MAAGGPKDVDQILWGDDRVYSPRYDKSATALVAVSRALESRRPLAGAEDEFLDLCAVIAATTPELFTQIWEDPFAYFWVRRAYELVGLCLKPTDLPNELRRYCLAIGANDPHEALKLHLEGFKRFVLALDIITGGTRRFRQPFETHLPFSIPGTLYSILGDGPVQIVGVIGNALDLIHDGRTLRLALDERVSSSITPRMIRRPSVRFSDFEVTLKPETFCLPGIGAADALQRVPEEFQNQQIPLIRQALALVERHQPDTLRQLGELIKVIALKPPLSGDYSNLSLSDLPGAFVLSAVPEPYWIADSLIHEFFHNRLFFITEEEPIFSEPEPDEDADEPGAFYSPWRSDLRPLSGLLHALYVYTGVCKFWFSVWQSGETDGSRRAYVEDQAVRWMYAIRIGAHQLRTRARFTEFGASLFKEMEKEAESLWAFGKTLGLKPSAPAMLVRPDGNIAIGGIDQDGRPLSIIETIRQHQKSYDKLHQCEDLDSITESNLNADGTGQPSP
jgi:HEXXH motif-containing protein